MTQLLCGETVHFSAHDLDAMMLSLLWCGACALVVVRRLRPLARGGSGEDADDALAMTMLILPLVMGLVPLAAFAVHVVIGWPVQAPLLSGVAAGMAALAIATMPRGKGPMWRQLLPVDVLQLAVARRGAVLLAGLAVAVLYWLRFGGPLSQFHCIREAAFMAWGSGGEGTNLLTGNVGDARLGNAAVMAGAIAWFHSQRGLHAALGMMLALGGWLVGKRAGGRGRWGWLGLAATACNPMVLAIPMVEENVLAAGFSAPVVVLALLRRPPWLVTGLLYGLVFSMRHPFAVALPALLLVAWQDGKARHGSPARSIGWLLLGAVLGSAVSHLHHLLAFGSLLAFESNAQFDAQPYTIFGMELKWRGMANWPLHDQLVRTPHNPYPMWVGWPLHLLDHVGLLLGGAMALGFLHSLRKDRKLGLFWALWWLPVYASFAVQEAWDHPNKMGVLAIGAPAFAAWMCIGCSALATRRPQAWIAWAALVGAMWASIVAVADWQAPADLRYFAVYHRVPIESQAWLAEARREATDIGLLPDIGRVNRYGAMLHPSKLNELEQYTAWGWFDNEIPPPGEPVTLELDLSRSFWSAESFVKLTNEAPHIDIVGKTGIHVATVPVAWDNQDLTVVATRGPRLGHIELAFVDFRKRERNCRLNREPCHCDYFDTYEHGTGAVSCQGIHSLGVLWAKRLRVRTTMRAISVTGLVSDIGHVTRLWRVRIGARRGELEASGPFLYWHD